MRFLSVTPPGRHRPLTGSAERVRTRTGVVLVVAMMVVVGVVVVVAVGGEGYDRSNRFDPGVTAAAAAAANVFARILFYASERPLLHRL